MSLLKCRGNWHSLFHDFSIVLCLEREAMMGHILCEKNVSQYLEDEPGWDIYSLLFDPLPILAYRNMNDYDDRYTKDDWHSTWSWRLNRNLNEAVEVACL